MTAYQLQAFRTSEQLDRIVTGHGINAQGSGRFLLVIVADADGARHCTYSRHETAHAAKAHKERVCG